MAVTSTCSVIGCQQPREENEDLCFCCLNNRMFKKPVVSAEWARSRSTAMPVAVAIHAIATPERDADAIWSNPDRLEFGFVSDAVAEYIERGDFEFNPNGYDWGAFVVPNKPISDDMVRMIFRAYDEQKEAERRASQLESWKSAGRGLLLYACFATLLIVGIAIAAQLGIL